MAKCDRGLAAQVKPQFVTMMDLSHYTAYAAWQQERDTVGDAPMEWLASYSDRWLNSPGFCERAAAINQTSDNVGVVRLTLTPDRRCGPPSRRGRRGRRHSALRRRRIDCYSRR